MVERSSSLRGLPAAIKTTPRSHCGRFANVSAAPAVASEPRPGVSTNASPLRRRSEGSATTKAHDALAVRRVMHLADKLRQALDRQRLHPAIREAYGQQSLAAMDQPGGTRRNRIHADRQCHGLQDVVQ